MMGLLSKNHNDVKSYNKRVANSSARSSLSAALKRSVRLSSSTRQKQQQKQQTYYYPTTTTTTTTKMKNNDRNNGISIRRLLDGENNTYHNNNNSINNYIQFRSSRNSSTFKNNSNYNKNITYSKARIVRNDGVPSLQTTTITTTTNKKSLDFATQSKHRHRRPSMPFSILFIFIIILFSSTLSCQLLPAVSATTTIKPLTSEVLVTCASYASTTSRGLAWFNDRLYFMNLGSLAVQNRLRYYEPSTDSFGTAIGSSICLLVSGPQGGSGLNVYNNYLYLAETGNHVILR
eukprot:PhM_4_TR5661/c0_g1_i1/m.69748